jgi:hypothetical protein
VVTVGQLLDFCGDIELRFAKVYAGFMFQLGSEDDRIAQFWESMSAEEWGHYVIVYFGRSLCERAGTLHDVVKTIESEALNRVQTVIEEREGLIQSGKYTLQEAFETAVHFEGSEADAIYLGLVRCVKQAIERLDELHLLRRIERVESRIHTHVEGLIKAIIRFGNNPDLVREARQLLSSHT